MADARNQTPHLGTKMTHGTQKKGTKIYMLLSEGIYFFFFCEI